MEQYFIQMLQALLAMDLNYLEQQQL